MPPFQYSPVGGFKVAQAIEAVFGFFIYPEKHLVISREKHTFTSCNQTRH